MGKLTARGCESRAKHKGRNSDGDGLYLRTLEPGKRVYWVYRYTFNGVERETSVGSYFTMSLAEARIKHAELRALVLKRIDPVGDKRNAKIVQPSGKPTFGQCADQRIAAHEGSWRNAKHARQWWQTLTVHAAPLRAIPVDQIATEHVLAVLRPMWSTTPETASRLRARIEAVLASAQVAGHIDPDKPNPARWRGWLDHMLPNPRKVGKPRGNHPAMPYKNVPAFMTRLSELSSGPTPDAARALMVTILTACRTTEVLGMTWDEISFETATWTIPKERMKKTDEKHEVPLSDAAVSILRAQQAVERGKNPYVFPGRPMRPLSSMAMSMLMRRMGEGAFTVHGCRTSFRTWASDVAHAEFEVAEQCLSHRVGSAVSRAYNRTSMLERRRPVMSAWANYVCGADADNVVPLRPFARADA